MKTNNQNIWDITTTEERAAKIITLATEDLDALVTRGVTAAFLDRTAANREALLARHAAQHQRVPSLVTTTAAQDAAMAAGRAFVADVRKAVGLVTHRGDEDDAPLRASVGIGVAVSHSVSAVRGALEQVAGAIDTKPALARAGIVGDDANRARAFVVRIEGDDDVQEAQKGRGKVGTSEKDELLSVVIGAVRFIAAAAVMGLGDRPARRALYEDLVRDPDSGDENAAEPGEEAKDGA